MAKGKIKLLQTTPEIRKKLVEILPAKAKKTPKARARVKKVQPEVPDEDRLQNTRRPADKSATKSAADSADKSEEE